MDMGMLIIVAVIVIPGYFMVNRLSKTMYVDNKKLEEETEKRYGFGRLEKELQKKTEAEEKKAAKLQNQDSQKIKKKKAKDAKANDSEVVQENCDQSRIEPLSNEKDEKIDKKITLQNENDQNK